MPRVRAEPQAAEAAEAAQSRSPHQRAPVLALPLALMARFKRLMQYEGWEIDVSRMFTDTVYAHGCLATAHTSSDERLRRTALSLFEAYGRNTAEPVLH